MLDHIQLRQLPRLSLRVNRMKRAQSSLSKGKLVGIWPHLAPVGVKEDTDFTPVSLVSCLFVVFKLAPTHSLSECRWETRYSSSNTHQFGNLKFAWPFVLFSRTKLRAYFRIQQPQLDNETRRDRSATMCRSTTWKHARPHALIVPSASASLQSLLPALCQQEPPAGPRGTASVPISSIRGQFKPKETVIAFSHRDVSSCRGANAAAEGSVVTDVSIHYGQHLTYGTTNGQLVWWMPPVSGGEERANTVCVCVYLLGWLWITTIQLRWCIIEMQDG